VTHAETLLYALDQKLNHPAELTLYGRAALHLGFPNAPVECALSRDIDAVLWIGQAELLAEQGNFWEAVAEVNKAFADQDLYISHFFEESQVILTPEWKDRRAPISGHWKNLTISRLGDQDLFLSKLMRDDPIDRSDALCIAKESGMTPETVRETIRRARIPSIPEIREQFDLCCQRILALIERETRASW